MRRNSGEFNLSMLDVMVMLYHMHKGAGHPKVGFEDSEQSLKSLTDYLSNSRIYMNKQALESALWSCNLMDEAGEFWSPSGDSFEVWVKKAINSSWGAIPHTFDRKYNRVAPKGRPSQGDKK